MPDSSTKLSLSKRFLQLLDPDQLRLWSRAYHGKKGWRAFWVRQLEIIVWTIHSLQRDELTLRAAALTYNTILSIVPLLAVGFALFKAFGGLQKMEGPLRQLILDNLAVGRAEEVGKWIEQFISKISAGAIAGVGVIFLFYSAIGLLTNIESAINRVWGVTKSRPLYIRFAIYWCIVTLAFPLLGFSVSFTARLQTNAFATLVVNWLPFGLGQWLLSLVSALSICVVLLLIFLIVPNTKVYVKAAAIGGFWTGLIWSIGKYIFITISASSLKYSAVYGALGVLPLLMLWIYVGWIIMLVGVTYTYAYQATITNSWESSKINITPASRELLSLRLSAGVALSFMEGRKPPTVEKLADEIGLGVSLIQNTLSALVTQRVIVEADAGEGQRGYLPARDIQQLMVGEILDGLHHQGGDHLSLDKDPLAQTIESLLQEAEQHGNGVLANLCLRDLVLKSTSATSPKPL